MGADKPGHRNQHDPQAAQQHRRDRILELRQADWTTPAIAAEVGTTVKAVSGVLRRLRRTGADLPPPRQGRPKNPQAAARHERILELRNQGQTLAAIATDVGMTPGAVAVVLSRLRKNGTPVPPPPPGRAGRKPQTQPEDPQPDRPTSPRQ